ncbi:MAG: ABC transporter substrate-binding protein [Pseudomonadota bacterium]|nr:ABC transporter substrate-binding protein [Pseudomonadota bacterium]
MENYVSKRFVNILILLPCLIISNCKKSSWNDPHSYNSSDNIIFSSFSAPPKTLDPAQAYSEDSYAFISQIYEPPLQYHYLKRPFELVPLSASEMPTIRYLDENGNTIKNENKSQIASTEYIIHIKPNQFYQNHPAFSKNATHEYKYLNLPVENLSKYRILDDFKDKDTRELVAADFVYEIKRLADPRVNSPILSMMEKHIVGLQEFSEELQKNFIKNGNPDLRSKEISGVSVIDKYTYKITLKGQYSQFIYWLAMPFFAPIPWEVDEFYRQPGMAAKNLTLSWLPVGSGPFMLSKNDPNSLMILSKNPNFHGEKFPLLTTNNSEYHKFAILQGKSLPLVDKYVLSLEKENIPYWYKFLQGYYDRSSISSNNFDQAIQISPNGKMELTSELEDSGISLETSTDPSIFYTGFNMLDPVVGGKSEENRLLRLAISIAIDFEEYVNIFLNGRGVVAQSNIPPGIFGSLQNEKKYNPYVYELENGIIKKKSLDVAKEYLIKAGYPNGKNIKNGKPLILYLDTVGSGPSAKAQANWYRKQLKKLGIDLYVRNTSWNRFQEKIRTGSTQIYTLGWNADYPDPENFLFLLFGPNGKVNYNGENTSNFTNERYDILFEKMKNLENNSERAEIIAEMTDILQQQAPWIWGFFSKKFILDHSWNGPNKINPIANNTWKYQSVNGKLRREMQQKWNKPNINILFVISIAILIILVPATIRYRRRTFVNQLSKF